jgi:GntR family transcriptional repressor for pyruvate dehydrogenase complex
MTQGSGRTGEIVVKRVLPAYQQVADQLRNLILSGELRPGSRLPAEADLTLMFGVSRGTVREALRVLASQQLVESHGASGGTRVVEPEPNSISELLVTGIGLLSGADGVSVDELLEARELLEVPAARLAAERRTDADVIALRRCLASSGKDLDRGHLFEGNREFHVGLLSAAHNRLIHVMTRPIFTVLTSRFRREAAPPDFWVQVNEDHMRIADAVERGDGELAASEMFDHLEHLRSTYAVIERTVVDDVSARERLAELVSGEVHRA